MATIARLPKLSTLDLKRAIFTNVGLENLSKTNSIDRLYLNGCNSVDDESISSLAKMKGLVILDVSDTKVSRAGKRRLSKKMKSTLIR
jgi:spore coat polysaccharide biosynthesis protein SpsF (cytidylyltransferase family)